MGIQMLPKWGSTFAVVRDDRGAQLVSLETKLSYQLVLSKNSKRVKNENFLIVDIDSRNNYTLTTLFDETSRRKNHICMLVLPPEFANALHGYTYNIIDGRTRY